MVSFDPTKFRNSRTPFDDSDTLRAYVIEYDYNSTSVSPNITCYLEAPADADESGSAYTFLYDANGNIVWFGDYDRSIDKLSTPLDPFTHKLYIAYNEHNANAGEKTTDTWEATVTFKNLDRNQNINVGKSFEGYFQINSYKDYSSDAIMQSNFEKCMQKWYPSFDVNERYATARDRICDGDTACENQFYERVDTCNLLWWTNYY